MASQVFESPYQWNLYGSAGRNSFAGNFLRRWRGPDGSDLILAKVEIAGLWPDRSEDRSDFTRLRPDYTVCLPQIIITKSALEALVAQLAQWLQTRDAVFADLCPKKDLPNQRLTLGMAPPQGTATLGQGLFSAEYSGISFLHGKCDYIVDQSCVRIFLDQLRAAFESLDAL